MKKWLIGIWVVIAFVFSLQEIKGESLQKFQTEISAERGCAHYAQICLDSHETVYALYSPFDLLAFDIFNSNIRSLLFSASSLPNGVNAPKNLKFILPFHEHSTSQAQLFTEDIGTAIYHSDFVKSPRRYFVYTLKRLLI